MIYDRAKDKTYYGRVRSVTQSLEGAQIEFMGTTVGSDSKLVFTFSYCISETLNA